MNESEMGDTEAHTSDRYQAIDTHLTATVYPSEISVCFGTITFLFLFSYSINSAFSISFSCNDTHRVSSVTEAEEMGLL